MDPSRTRDFRDLNLHPAGSPVSNEDLRWDKIEEEIIQWLKPPDPRTNYNRARQVRHKGTTKWFLSGNVFKEWKSKGSLLWIHGMRMFVILP